MAALLLRQGAARRLAGSMVQRARPAIADERSRLGPRLMHTEEQAHQRIERQIQRKKDELYDLISKGEEDVRTSTLPNAWLLLYLSDQVTPRPYDPDWLDLQKTRNVFSWVRRVGLFSLTCVAMDYYNGYSDMKVARAMMMEEEHDAREVETGSRLTEMEN